MSHIINIDGQQIAIYAPDLSSSCDSGLYMLTSAELAGANIWDFQPDLAVKFFSMSLVLILTCYLVAWGFGQIISMLEKG